MILLSLYEIPKFFTKNSNCVVSMKECCKTMNNFTENNLQNEIKISDVAPLYCIFHYGYVVKTGKGDEKFYFLWTSRIYIFNHSILVAFSLRQHLGSWSANFRGILRHWTLDKFYSKVYYYIRIISSDVTWTFDNLIVNYIELHKYATK